jgi:hypothetical protein
MSSLVSKSQQQSLDKETVDVNLRLRGGMHHPSSTGKLHPEFESLRKELSLEMDDLMSLTLNI